MKLRILCSVVLLVNLVLINLSCEEENFTPIPRKPTDIFPIDLCPTLLTNVTALFPESKNNQEKYAQIFSNTSQQRVVLTRDTEVYVTFVNEAATIGNVLGYYIYNSSSTPGSPDEIQKEIIFPDIDNSILSPGDTRQLGSTPLKGGMVIGFFLINGGYRNEGVYFKRPTSYTDQNLNADQAKQHVLYRENECGAIVVGFEDKNSTTADKDFNDIIFMVSDNIDSEENTAFDLQNVVSLSK
ncbi:MAG: DUF4114 domain-containing protein [Cyclobacteriaceae bacterium]